MNFKWTHPSPGWGQTPSLSAHLADNLHECLLWLKACSLSQMSTRITLIQVAALAGAHKTSSATLVRAACNVQCAACSNSSERKPAEKLRTTNPQGVEASGGGAKRC